MQQFNYANKDLNLNHMYQISIDGLNLTLIWVCGRGGNFTLPPVAFPLITQKR